MRSAVFAALTFLAVADLAQAGAQKYEPLAASVQATMHESVSEREAPEAEFSSPEERETWLAEMSLRLQDRMPDRASRIEFLKTVHYEAKRAGLDPQLVLGLIQVESRFRKYAVSQAGARGYMQVMPFWVTLIGKKDHNLFHMRVNLRYGCTILRHYLDIEHGSLYRALGRYNGSLGQPVYPNMVRAAWQRQWHWKPPKSANLTMR
jgi:soluble lytic murein transglycosylase-like protein